MEADLIRKDQLSDQVKLSFFTEIGKAINSAATIKEILDAVMEHVGRIFAPSHWSLLLRNPKTGELKFSVVVGSGVEMLKGMTLAKGEGIVGWIAENGQPLIIEDVSRDTRFSSAIDKISGFRTESIIGVPLKQKGKVIGVIELINKLDGQNFTPLELQLLTTIADLAAIAIDKAFYMRELKRIAYIDQLTGLYNRRCIVHFFEKESNRSSRTGRPFTVMMIDMDRFKQINDTYGHRAGDDALVRASRYIKGHLRTADYISRLGGDEFLILLPETNRTQAEDLKRRLIANLEGANEGQEIPILFSIGIYESQGESFSIVMHNADLEMYREKTGDGRPSV